MAELINDLFDGTTLGGQWVTDHRNGGSLAVSGGLLTLSSTAAADSRGVARQAVARALADGDTLTLCHDAFTNNFTGFVGIRQQDGDSAFIPGIMLHANTWRAVFWRPSTGIADQGSNVPIPGNRWVRLRRNALTLVLEAAPDEGGAPGTFATFHTFSPGGAWTENHAESRAELVSSEFGNAVASSWSIRQVGTGGPPSAMSHLYSLHARAAGCL
jgi:hypothetical protein